MHVRLLLLIAVLLLAVVTLFLLLLATDTALSVWQRLREAPLWVQVSYTLILLLISSATIWLSWRLLKPAKGESTDTQSPPRRAVFAGRVGGICFGGGGCHRRH